MLIRVIWHDYESERLAGVIRRLCKEQTTRSAGSGERAVSWRLSVRRHARSSRDTRTMWVQPQLGVSLCCAVLIIEFGLILVKWRFTTLLLRFYRHSPVTSGARVCTGRRPSAPSRGLTYNHPVKTDRPNHRRHLTSSLRSRATRAMRRRTHVIHESAAVARALARPQCTRS